MKAGTEQIFFDEAGIKITSARMVVPGQVHSLRDVQAVHAVVSRHDRVLPLIIMTPGLVLGVGGLFRQSGAAAFLGLMLLVVGGIAWRFQDIVHRVILTGPAGETVALVNPDLVLVERVVIATSAALVERRSIEPLSSTRSVAP